MLILNLSARAATPRLDIGGEDGAGGRPQTDSAAIFQSNMNTAANLTLRGVGPLPDSSSAPPTFAPDPGDPGLPIFDGTAKRLATPAAAAGLSLVSRIALRIAPIYSKCYSGHFGWQTLP